MLALGLLVSPAFTQAAGLTSTQVQAILSLLSSFGADQSVINKVSNDLGGTLPVRTNFCHTFNTDLTFGSNVDEANALQEALVRENVLSASKDGFTEDVAAAVVQFQAKYGIRQTGYVGPITRAKLNSLYGCTVIEPTVASINLTSPNGGESWKIGETHTISWVSQGANAINYPVQIGIIDTRYSTEAGDRREHIIANKIPNTGSYSWTIPTSLDTMNLNDTSSPVYKIIVHSWSDTTTGTALSGGSNAPFSILSDTVIPGGAPTISYLSPAVGQPGGSVVIYGTNFGNSTYIVIDGTTTVFPNTGYPVAVAATPGTYALAFTIPTGLAAGNHSVQVGNKGSAYSLSTGATLTISSTAASAPVITAVSTKAAGNFEVDSGGSAMVVGTNLAGDAKVYIGGIQSPVTQTGDTLLYVTVPTSLTVGQSYPMYLVNSHGTSNVVTVKILSLIGPTVLLTVSPTTVAAGQNATITWSSANTSSCTFTNYGDWAANGAPLSGSNVVNVQATKTITLTCKNASGQTATQSATITVLPAVPTATISASPTNVTSGQSTRITWSSTNASQCIFGGDFTAGNGVAQSPSGSVTETPTKAVSTYSIRCTDPMQLVQTTQSVTVTMTAPTIAAPTISSLSPSSGPVGTKVQILGSGFTRQETGCTNSIPAVCSTTGSLNTIYFNGAIIAQVSYTTSGEVDFVVPSSAGDPVGPGTYSVKVQNANGTSNSVSFTVPQPVTVVCDYPNPPFGCEYVPGSSYNSTTNCGLVLQCSNMGASALNAYQNAAAKPASSVRPFVYTWTRDLQIGSPYVDDVSALQTALMIEGVYAGEVTGGFYAQTYAAVKAFQGKYGIDATGFVGSDTRAKLNELF